MCHSNCLTLDSGRVLCFGANHYGQLGNGKCVYSSDHKKAERRSPGESKKGGRDKEDNIDKQRARDRERKRTSRGEEDFGESVHGVDVTRPKVMSELRRVRFACCGENSTIILQGSLAYLK